MSELALLYILQVLTTLTFILLAYYLLSYISNRMKFKKKEPILAFKAAIIAGSLDLALTFVSSIAGVNKVLVYIILVILELALFYLLVKEVYKLNWKHALSLAFFLILALFVSEILVIIGMVAFLAMYASI